MIAPIVKHFGESDLNRISCLATDSYLMLMRFGLAFINSKIYPCRELLRRLSNDKMRCLIITQPYRTASIITHFYGIMWLHICPQFMLVGLILRRDYRNHALQSISVFLTQDCHVSFSIVLDKWSALINDHFYTIFEDVIITRQFLV